MNNPTIEDLKREVDKRYIDMISNPVLSKEELLEKIRNVDFNVLNVVLKNQEKYFEELESFAKLAEKYIEISPEFTKQDYSAHFTKNECIDIVRNFFYKEDFELGREFDKKLANSQLNETAPNRYRHDGIVFAKIYDEGNTVEQLTAMMHEFTHSFKSHSGEISSYGAKLAELPTLLNEFYFLDYLNSLNNPEISNDAKNHMLYKLSDTKYMAYSPLFEGDIVKIFRENGEINLDLIEKYVDSLDLKSQKGLMFLQTGEQYLSRIASEGQLYYRKQGRYQLAELVGSKLYYIDGYQERLGELCEIIGKEQVTNDDLKKLRELGIPYISSDSMITISDADLQDLGQHFNHLVNQINGPKITQTDEFSKLLENIESDSLYSSKQLASKYMKEYEKQIQQQENNRKVMVEYVRNQRLNNSNLSEQQFYSAMMSSFLTPIVEKIKDEYGNDLPAEKMSKVEGLLNPKNIVFTLDNNKNDIQADSEKGKLEINPQKTSGDTLEEKIVSSMGSSTHETFHLMINMLKPKEQAEELGERLMYKVSTNEGEKELHFAPGRYGQVLSEGFVEKMSSEFASRNGIYNTISPSYISYVNLCSYLMEQDPTINNKFLFTNNADAVVNRMTPVARTSFEATERLAVFNNFDVKEVKKDENLKGIKSDSVISSWMERNGVKNEEKVNPNFNKIFQINKQLEKQNESIESKKVEKKSFDKPSIEDAKLGRDTLKENVLTAGQKKQEYVELSKQNKQLVLTNNNHVSGFASLFFLALVTGFVAGIGTMIIYLMIR